MINAFISAINTFLEDSNFKVYKILSQSDKLPLVLCQKWNEVYMSTKSSPPHIKFTGEIWILDQSSSVLEAEKVFDKLFTLHQRPETLNIQGFEVLWFHYESSSFETTPKNEILYKLSFNMGYQSNA